MVEIRDMIEADIPFAQSIVESHWGPLVAENAAAEMTEMFTSNSKWPPHYFVADLNGEIIGFAGYKSAWLMTNAYELIWINIKKGYQRIGIGKQLTKHRIEHIKNLGGTLVLLMTKRPLFFAEQGFHINGFFTEWTLMSQQLGPVTLPK